MLDFSTGGCRIDSSVEVHCGATFKLSIYVPDLELPLTVEAATVQWGIGQMFGLAFLKVEEAERERMGALLATLRAQRDDRLNPEGSPLC